MIPDTQTLKIEITASLDMLSLEELQRLQEYLTFLRWQNQQREAAPDSLLKEGSPLVEQEIPAASRVGWKDWDQRFDQ